VTGPASAGVGVWFFRHPVALHDPSPGTGHRPLYRGRRLGAGYGDELEKSLALPESYDSAKRTTVKRLLTLSPTYNRRHGTRQLGTAHFAALAAETGGTVVEPGCARAIS